MKKQFLLCLSLLFSIIIMAKNVTEQQAKDVARNFLSQTYQKNSTSVQISDLSLVLGYSKDETGNDSKIDNGVLIYVFNVDNQDAFVIVSGDDRVIPVLGYSSTSKFSNTNIPPALQKMIEGYKMQLLYAQQQDLGATPEIEEQWHNLTENIPLTAKSTSAVSPLLSTTWNQSPYYNALCPYDYSHSEYTVSGCVATAMAQIMKYWNYPATGTGFHSYDDPNYGTQTANFASTTYQWSSMPNDVSSANNAVATLMYHCGVSVDMSYGIAESGGSSAYVVSSASPVTQCAEYSYKTYFGYDPATLQGLQRSNYSDNDWINLLKADLNSSRPLQYAGFGSGGGHTFVCDGYDAGNFFHMNWGWGGAYDGYFELDALNPGGVGIGGGTGGFNSGQQAVIGIKPLSGGSATSSIEVYSSITINPDPINFYQPFTVNADVHNAGTSSFNGEFCAAIFDSQGTFIDFVQILGTNGSPLPAGYHYNGGLNFANDGMPTVPGDYIIGIYYREVGGEWSEAASTSYSSYVTATINSPSNPLEQYSEIVATPSTFVQGSAASVNVNFYNTGTSTYLGQYWAALYDLEGNFVETIGTYNETTGLPSGYVYSAPYITFSSSSITAAPGTYILAIIEQESGSSSMYFIGGTYFKTPVNIVVIEPANIQDVFEPDDTQATAYTLPVSWNNNAAQLSTTGSNNHAGNDYDYYRINLADGYDYTITARVHDSYNSGNGNVYTCDVIWSYNTGAGWSSAYDDVMIGNILVNGPGTIYFQVSPYFSGNSGTYLLDIKILRKDNNGIPELNGKYITLSPNPATTTLVLHTDKLEGSSGQWQVLNELGQIVLNGTISSNTQEMDISDLAFGTYLFSATIRDKQYVKRFIRSR
jgi:hypothetical protein